MLHQLQFEIMVPSIPVTNASFPSTTDAATMSSSMYSLSRELTSTAVFTVMQLIDTSGRKFYWNKVLYYT